MSSIFIVPLLLPLCAFGESKVWSPPSKLGGDVGVVPPHEELSVSRTRTSPEYPDGPPSPLLSHWVNHTLGLLTSFSYPVLSFPFVVVRIRSGSCLPTSCVVLKCRPKFPVCYLTISRVSFCRLPQDLLSSSPSRRPRPLSVWKASVVPPLTPDRSCWVSGWRPLGVYNLLPGIPR